jgi:hypothetical protein
MYKMLHTRADTDRMYIKRKEKGGGVFRIEATYKAEIITTAEYQNTR